VNLLIEFFEELKKEEETDELCKQGMAQTYHNFGTFYSLNNNFLLAEKMYLRSIEINQEISNKAGMAETYSNLGSTYANYGNLQLAETMLEKSMGLWKEIGNIDAKRKVEEHWNNLKEDKGVILYEHGKLNEALEVIKQQLKDNPSNNYAWYNLGVVLQDKGDINDAISAFKKVEGQEIFLSAKIKVAMLFAKKGELDNAIEYLHTVPLENDEDKFNLKLFEAQLLTEYEHHAKASLIYDQLLRQYPNNIDLLNMKANILWNEGKLSEAERIFYTALSLQPENLILLTGDAELALIQGDTSRCKDRIVSALLKTTPKHQESAILPFIAWLAGIEKRWEEVLNKISLLESDVVIAWNFSTMTPAIERHDKTTQQMAQHFIDFFTRKINLLELKSKLENTDSKESLE